MDGGAEQVPDAVGEGQAERSAHDHPHDGRKRQRRSRGGLDRAGNVSGVDVQFGVQMGGQGATGGQLGGDGDTIPSLAPSTAPRSQFSRPAIPPACGSQG